MLCGGGLLEEMLCAASPLEQMLRGMSPERNVIWRELSWRNGMLGWVGGGGKPSGRNGTGAALWKEQHTEVDGDTLEVTACVAIDKDYAWDKSCWVRGDGGWGRGTHSMFAASHEPQNVVPSSSRCCCSETGHVLIWLKNVFNLPSDEMLIFKCLFFLVWVFFTSAIAWQISFCIKQPFIETVMFSCTFRLGFVPSLCTKVALL